VDDGLGIQFLALKAAGIDVPKPEKGSPETSLSPKKPKEAKFGYSTDVD
jgi:hypothetical protein